MKGDCRVTVFSLLADPPEVLSLSQCANIVIPVPNSRGSGKCGFTQLDRWIEAMHLPKVFGKLNEIRLSSRSEK